MERDRGRSFIFIYYYVSILLSLPVLLNWTVSVIFI